jgi:hypothetical protein
MQRAKTQRKRAPSTPALVAGDTAFTGETILKATDDSLDALFAAESEATFHQPWAKLDRGSRLDRLRKFVQAYVSPTAGAPALTPAERASLLSAVLAAFELRQLNTKVAVEYDPTTATVQSIRGLRERAAPSGLRTFRIDPTATARTTHKATRVPKAAIAESSKETPSPKDE